MILIFLNSMGPQLSNAHSIIKIGKKLASVRYFKIWWSFFLTPPLIIFIRGVIFWVRVQSLNEHTETSFCPILIIENALESWDPIEFKKISLILCALTRHKMRSKSLTSIFWSFCVQNARKKKMTYCFDFYGISAFQRTFDDQNQTKKLASVRYFTIWWKFFLDPYSTENFRKWGHFSGSRTELK